MKKSNLPKTDSIHELAEFWDTHDLTEFEDELKEVAQPVFTRSNKAAINVPLKSREAAAVRRLARLKGVSPPELIRAWVLQRIADRSDR